MGSHTPVEDDPEQLEAANRMWAGFAVGTKWTIRLVAVVLIGLLIAYVPMG
ncbi:MAG: hypothetical protein JKY71_10835 [Alphaproteobacteria bacterium]|nr:hypothetical protein [Alphaproteobacteria bacterium]